MSDNKRGTTMPENFYPVSTLHSVQDKEKKPRKKTATKTTKKSGRTRRRKSVPMLSEHERCLGIGLVASLGIVVLIMLVVSLEHLATGIQEITQSTSWSAWALAIAIDVGMVASEVALIVLATLPNIMVSTYALRYVVATVVISIALNIWAFWPTDYEGNVIGMSLAVVLGAGIPLGVYHLTRVAGRIWLAASNRLESSA
jgi:hypothetical protein